MSGVLSTQLSGIARRPVRLLLTGLAVLIAAFVVYATVLGHQVTTRTVLAGLAGTPAAADLVVTDGAGEALRRRIAALPGVAATAGRLDTGFELNRGAGDYLSVQADPGAGPLATVTLASGTYPARPGQVAVTPRTAERLELTTGSTVTVRGWDPDTEKETARTLTVTGIVTARSDSGAQAYAPSEVVGALNGGDYLTQIDVHLAPGADPAAVERAVAPLLTAPAGETPPRLRTGAEVRTAEAEQATSDVGAVFALVGMFIAIAVIAAALVATSTFRIVFAQRMRQLALLRAVGAGRRGLSGALVTEGALIGLVTGAVGVGLAALLGAAAPHLVGLFGMRMAAPGAPLLPAVAVVAGAILVTVLAVLAPAANAAKVSPLEALRAASTTASQRTIGWVRAGFGVLLAGAAAAAAVLVVSMLPGRDEQNYDPAMPLLLVVASGALAFFALMALGPVLVRPVLHVIGLPLRRVGPIGRLAVGGIGGAPRRAAAVSVVVALGVTLIAGTLVGAASLRTLAESEIALEAPADLELVADGDDPLPAAVVQRVAASDKLANVTPYRRVTARVPGLDMDHDAIDVVTANLPALRGVHPESGSLADLGPGRVLIAGWLAADLRVRAGDPVPVTVQGRTVTVTVGAVLGSSGPLGAALVLDPADLTALGAPAGASGVLADAARTGEQGRTEARAALREAAGADGAVAVLADQRDEINRLFDALVAIAVGLIGLTVLIAVVGVGTTTALSVVERVRESGLLRAVGLSRTGLRAMLTAESGLYGLMGAVLGLALGVPYAFLAVRALGLDAPLEVPYWQLGVVLIALTALTALAGVLPARRAARVSPVAALATDG
ncbi:FtsX-like permease family protein [Spirilliplanes yamanashiensis]|uniref:ABC transporter n=1 Tax=Spirilliplanes yamanashiensis TaxID=42233 RepID=A0A8J3YBH6_9ACTN|nr:ABC transporter permease [Spirilliplanes yamanashiensis]MDP9818028.1 putative ABC transport system permease protein [Spirilliplanes yamanashiensis]GIJ04837.1 ABC transporter [Spirilliplanes yamanashiensis]